MSQTLFESLKYFYQIPSHIQLGVFREWLSDRGQCTSMEYKDIPLWVYFIQHGAWECLRELLDHPRDQIFLNYKNSLGRGFIHLCVYAGTPEKIITKGISFLDGTWMDPDKLGHTPFDIIPPPHVAQKMAWRYWTERPDMRECAKFFRSLARQAREIGEEDTARVWDFWVSGPKDKTDLD